MYTYLFMELIHLATPQKPTHSVVMKCNEHANEKPTVSGIQAPVSAHICRVTGLYAAGSVSSVVASPCTAGSAAHTTRSSCNRA